MYITHIYTIGTGIHEYEHTYTHTHTYLAILFLRASQSQPGWVIKHMQCCTSKLLNHRIHAYLYRATSQHIFHSKANDQKRWTGWSARTFLLVHVSDRRSNPDSKQKTETEALFSCVLPDFILSKPLSVTGTNPVSVSLWNLDRNDSEQELLQQKAPPLSLACTVRNVACIWESVVARRLVMFSAFIHFPLDILCSVVQQFTCLSFCTLSILYTLHNLNCCGYCQATGKIFVQTCSGRFAKYDHSAVGKMELEKSQRN